MVLEQIAPPEQTVAEADEFVEDNYPDELY